MGISGNKDKQKIGIDQIAKCRLEKMPLQNSLPVPKNFLKPKSIKRLIYLLIIPRQFILIFQSYERCQINTTSYGILSFKKRIRQFACPLPLILPLPYVLHSRIHSHNACHNHSTCHIYHNRNNSHISSSEDPDR